MFGVCSTQILFEIYIIPVSHYFCISNSNLNVKEKKIETIKIWRWHIAGFLKSGQECILFVKHRGGVDMRSMYIQYVQGIQPNILSHTTFLDFDLEERV